MSVVKKNYYKITSLEKGIRVLEMLAKHKALTVTELGRELDTHRAGAHRFLATLRDLGYVEKNDDNKYELTFKMFEIGQQVAGRFEIRQIARRYMQELSTAFKETVNLGFWHGTEIFHLDKIDSHEILRIDAPLGSKTPAYCTGLGKAILAHLSEDALNDYFKRVRLVPHGPNTIVAKKDLREELKKTRERGYALDNEEFSQGLRCVAAPVFDHTGQANYAMSISCPSMRLSLDDVDQVHPKIRDMCGQLSIRMGYQPKAQT
ncbi:MAG: IclR family transcriptional regulator [Desulfobacterales bacterium]|jgi:DNA-binding IclR family transcriptional regulator